MNWNSLIVTLCCILLLVTAFNLYVTDTYASKTDETRKFIEGSLSQYYITYLDPNENYPVSTRLYARSPHHALEKVADEANTAVIVQRVYIYSYNGRSFQYYPRQPDCETDVITSDTTDTINDYDIGSGNYTCYTMGEQTTCDLLD